MVVIIIQVRMKIPSRVQRMQGAMTDTGVYLYVLYIYIY